MPPLKAIVKRAIASLPRSRTVAACCRHYVRHCEGHASVWASDPDGVGEMRTLRELAPHITVALDVGANVGSWTAALLAQNPKAVVHAFEPARDAFTVLENRQFPGSVSRYRVAMSSHSGRSRLHLVDGSPELNSLHNRVSIEGVTGKQSATSTEEVELSTIDSFCASHGLQHVDLLKIDTEGHEIDVLLGSIRGLQDGIIRRVQFEYGGTYIDSRRLLKDAFDLFSGLDFTLFRIFEDGLIALPRYDYRLEDFRYSNYLALRHDVIAATASARTALEQVR